MQGTVLSLSVSPRNTPKCNKSEAQNSWNDTRSRTSAQQIWFFIRDDLKVKSISATAVNHVEMITTRLPDVVVHSVYKPPSEQFLLLPLGHRIMPHIVIGDFNSHITISGYDDTDNNGIAVVQRAESNSLHSFTVRNCRNLSTVQDGRKVTTQIPYLHLP